MFWRKQRLNYKLDQSFLLDTKLRDMPFTVFDTETTGFAIAAYDGLIEIGAVHVDKLEVTDRVFQTFVKPLGEIPEHITKLTSIEQHHVENAPTPLEAIESYFQFIEDTKSGGWIGHHVSFDTLVIKKELQRVKCSYEEPPSFDTIDLINYLNPSWDQRDLAEYARIFGTRTFERHRALGDALTTAHLFIELLKRLEDKGVLTLADLLRLKHGKLLLKNARF
ncbi:3'-5' exonuclease [Sporosarcina sp. E16_3]|uniref:3'-5' exonuclease n=1 Tax=Sporosarcina sp. E16_3 TaxID=2789293 RepID=UPI001A91A560|nr:exonuclease domain-containing protein [Sporosarcina sp. E16_3]MBO0602338.1 3'-5' exonuclease [Sporosarcina sp. E16_3]